MMAINTIESHFRTKDMTVRVVRRTKRSGSKVYVLVGSSEFLLSVLPYFHSNSTPALKYVLVATDNWSSNFSYGIFSIDIYIYIEREREREREID